MNQSLRSLATLATLAVGAITSLQLAVAQEDGFKSLFNGKDLTGWEGNPKLWSVQEGAITGKTGSDEDTKISHNTFLVSTAGDVGDFELRLSYRIVGGNSGIQYRSKISTPGKFGSIVGGYQADFEAGKTYSGILYEERGRGILAQRGQKTVIKADGYKHKVEVAGSVGKSEEIQAKIKPEDWNDYVVIAQGNHLQHFINGAQTVDVVDEHEAKAAKSGVLALQIHAGPPMTVQFKNVRIKNPGTAAAGGDLEKLKGRWVASEGVANGQPIPAEEVQKIVLTLEGNTYKVEIGDFNDAGKFTVNEAAEPRSMDAIPSSGDQAGKVVQAIYTITDDTFRVCYSLNGGDRPTKFEAPADSSYLLLTYKRK